MTRLPLTANCHLCTVKTQKQGLHTLFSETRLAQASFPSEPRFAMQSTNSSVQRVPVCDPSGMHGLQRTIDGVFSAPKSLDGRYPPWRLCPPMLQLYYLFPFSNVWHHPASWRQIQCLLRPPACHCNLLHSALRHYLAVDIRAIRVMSNNRTGMGAQASPGRMIRVSHQLLLRRKTKQYIQLSHPMLDYFERGEPWEYLYCR